MTAEDSNTTEQAGGVEDVLARNGKLSYIHIPAIDVVRSGEFYAAVFGWTVHDRGSRSRMSFTDASGELIGAWVTESAVSREPGIEPYIYVDRIDETVRQIEANGGEIVRTPYPEGDLWIATFRDPAGN